MLKGISDKIKNLINNSNNPNINKLSRKLLSIIELQ